MQQQIQQHQRQLYQALLMKQQQLPSHSSSSSSSSTGLHPPGGPAGGPGSGKSTLDPFTGTHQAPSLADTLHTKEPPSSPSAYSTYPLCESALATTQGWKNNNMVTLFKTQIFPWHRNKRRTLIVYCSLCSTWFCVMWSKINQQLFKKTKKHRAIAEMLASCVLYLYVQHHVSNSVLLCCVFEIFFFICANINKRFLCFVFSWTESKHECKLHGGWGSVP